MAVIVGQGISVSPVADAELSHESTSTVQNKVVTDAIASEYSTSKTYSVGDVCTHDGKLYECIVDIPTAEGWTLAHWKVSNLGDNVSNLNRQLSDKQDAPATAGTAGQVLGLDDQLHPVWTDQTGGGGNVLVVAVTTKDGAIVTGQTVTIRETNASGPIVFTETYNGQPLGFNVDEGNTYHVSVSNTLVGYWNPTTAIVTISKPTTLIVLTFEPASNMVTFPQALAALNDDLDLTPLIGHQLITKKNGTDLVWDIVDYDATSQEITLLTHDLVSFAAGWGNDTAICCCLNGLPAGPYAVAFNGAIRYFSLQNAIPNGGLIFFNSYNPTTFTVRESAAASSALESGAVSTEEISGATSLNELYSITYYERINATNNFAESHLFEWLNSSAGANATYSSPIILTRTKTITLPGFLNGWDAEDLACLADTAWKCIASNIYEFPPEYGGQYTKGERYTVTSKIGLPSKIELGGPSSGVDAGETVFALYENATNADRIKYLNGVAKQWWTRSTRITGSNYAHNVKANGTWDFYATNMPFDVAPCCKIRKNNGGTP